MPDEAPGFRHFGGIEPVARTVLGLGRKEAQRRPRSNVDLLAESRRLDRKPLAHQGICQRHGSQDAATVHGSRGCRQDRIARIEQDQALVRKDRRHDRRNRRRNGRLGQVGVLQKVQDFSGMRFVADRVPQRRQRRQDAGAQTTVANGDPGGASSGVSDRQSQRCSRSARHQTVGDLRKIMVFGLQPEDRHARPARLCGQRACDRDGGGRLVDREQGPQEQTDLLPGDDSHRARTRQGRQVGVARGTLRKRSVLGDKRGMDRGSHLTSSRIGDGEGAILWTPKPIRQQVDRVGIRTKPGSSERCAHGRGVIAEGRAMQQQGKWAGQCKPSVQAGG